MLVLLVLWVHCPETCDGLAVDRRQQQQQERQYHRSLSITPASTEELYPPLVLLGGIAQTRSSWDHHLPSLSKHRRVVVYECLGQGDHRPSTATTPSSTSGDDEDKDDGVVPSFFDASLPAQARTLLEILEDNRRVLLPVDDDDSDDDDDGDTVTVDVAGFSFGGRVALAAACLLREEEEDEQQQQQQQQRQGGRRGVRIRRLHLAGVGCGRSDAGCMALRSFPDILRGDPSLRSFAWSVLLATYAPGFLRKLPEPTLDRILGHIASTNRPNRDGLLAILEQAEVTDAADPWHVSSMADRLNVNNDDADGDVSMAGKLCAGELDAMAPVSAVEELRARSTRWIRDAVDVLPGCGHAVVIEDPRAWRESLLSFLDDD